MFSCSFKGRSKAPSAVLPFPSTSLPSCRFDSTTMDKEELTRIFLTFTIVILVSILPWFINGYISHHFFLSLPTTFRLQLLAAFTCMMVFCVSKISHGHDRSRRRSISSRRGSRAKRGSNCAQFAYSKSKSGAIVVEDDAFDYIDSKSTDLICSTIQVKSLRISPAHSPSLV